MSTSSCQPLLDDPVVPEPSESSASSVDRSTRIRTTKLAHTIEEIQRELAHGHIPVTDNIDALVALGFSRNRPQDPHDTTWSRAVESADLRGGYKHQVIERAELVAAATFGVN